YFDLLPELISKAEYFIHLQFYIIEHDATGRMIVDALVEAAKRKVKVYFIADGYASGRLPRSFINYMRENGIYFKFFEPLFRSDRFYFGRRMHKKVAVIDGKSALIGGVNLTNRYNDLPGSPAWMDFAVFVQGEASLDLVRHCNKMWKNSKIPPPQLPSDMNSFLQEIPPANYCSVRVRVNDFVRYRNQIWRSYFELFNHSQHQIIIMCSYFLPGWELLRRLGQAAKRGVEIKIILAGISDVAVAKNAERYLYSWMLRNHIRIYEYQPRVLHAKIAVADDHWVTVGSYNINNISAHASIELNLDIRNKLFARHVHQELADIMERDCMEVTTENFEVPVALFRKFVRWASYLFIKIVLKLFTFYFRRDAEMS
ncbi:MAG: phospholipase, partial [Bacteroidota bacterium]|nr:phospholipase [Bacteroidota bacterium]